MSNFTSSSSKEDGSMISNLPLLFSDGLPTSLDKIKLVTYLNKMFPPN